MRDTIKPKDYFLKRIQNDTARIKKFEETLKNTEPSNERGIRIGKSQLSKLFLDCAKASYSMGADLEEVYSYYVQSINHYKDACKPADSLFGVIDYLSIGVLFHKSKQEFLAALETIATKFKARQKILCKSRNASVVSRQRIRSKYCLNPSGTEFVLTRLTYLCSGMRDGMHAQRECRLSSRKC